MTTEQDVKLNREQRRALKHATRQPGSARRKPIDRLRDPVGYVIEGLTPLTEQEDGKYITNWKIRVHSAMHSVLKGEAKKSDMDDLVASWNVTSALCNIHGLEDESVIRGKQALIDLCGRASKIKRVVAKAEEIKALNELVALHDEWIDSITVRQMEDALAWCKDRRNQGHVLRGEGIPK